MFRLSGLNVNSRRECARGSESIKDIFLTSFFPAAQLSLLLHFDSLLYERGNFDSPFQARIIEPPLGLRKWRDGDSIRGQGFNELWLDSHPYNIQNYLPILALSSDGAFSFYLTDQTQTVAIETCMRISCVFDNQQ